MRYTRFPVAPDIRYTSLIVFSLGWFIMGFIVSLPFSLSRCESEGLSGLRPAPTVHHHLKPMHAAAVTLRNDLEAYYGTHSGMLTAGWKIDPPTDNYTRDQIIKSVHGDAGEFIVGTLGSSVSAGHDGCYYLSYEKQLERMLKPVFQAGGMDYVHRNAGQGGGCGDSHRNQVYCVKNLVGQDVDIVHAVWTYFGDTKIAFENLVRWSLLLDKSPPVHLYNTGAHDRSTCYEDEPFARYRQWGHNGVCLESGLESGGEFHGREWGHVGDGYHPIVRDGENETVQELRDEMGIVYKNWHPGALGHQFVADMFAYAYAGYIIDASLEETPVPPPRVITEVDLGETLWATPSPLPECTNFETPTYGYAGTKVVGPGDDWNPHKGEVPQGFIEGKGRGSNSMVPAVFRKYWPEEKCNYLDTCSHLLATDAGIQVFRLPQMTTGTIILCGDGKHASDEMFMNNPSLEVEVDGKILPRANWKGSTPEEKCVTVQGTFGVDSPVPEHGHSYLTLRLTDRPPRPFRLTHVITI